MMANLNHIQIDNENHLFSYYITLCHVYYFNVSDDNSEKDRLQTEGTIDMISSLIFHAINIEGTTIREMENEQYEKDYKRFYNDILTAIKECSKNEVDYPNFLEIIDDIIGAAIKLASAFEKLTMVKEIHDESSEGIKK